ncbi:MAG: hypothetical protein WCC48_12215 [Anaeromyxobacteraceae bacterium]
MTSLATQAFAEYLSRLELNATRVAQAATSYNFLKDWIESVLPGASVRRIGSFQRQTKIRPFADGHEVDVDALVCLGSVVGLASPGTPGITTQHVLEKVRQVLSQHGLIRLMQPKKDAPTVTLNYADETFSVELVPALIDGSRFSARPFGPPSYLIPGSDGRWITADYDYDAQYISSLNQRSDVDGDLVRVIKLAKAWSRASGVDLKSFFLEALAAALVPDIISEWSGGGLAWELPHVFAAFLARAPDFVRVPIEIPGSFSEQVHSGAFGIQGLQVEDFIRKQSRRAYTLAFEADQIAACEGWRAFFQDPFPALASVA